MTAMNVMNDEDLEYFEEMENKEKQADLMDFEEFKTRELCRMYNCTPEELDYLQECDKRGM